MKLCWLIPDDRGGGVASVALSCCRQAAKAGHETTLLMVLVSTGWIGTDHDFRVSSLGLSNTAQEAPEALLQWLEDNPQDALFLNGCEQADAVIPYLPSSVKCVYVVHDTAPRYWRTAVTQEDQLEAIAVVSETITSQFRQSLKQAEKLSVILNGCVFPELPELNRIRQNELIFLGGDNPTKGAFDAIKLWKKLVKFGFTGKLHWFGRVTPEFKAKIDQLPHSERIQVYGRVNRDLIFSKAASAKVVLMLSRVEPFGMATIEAMSMGCVPVAWDIDTGTKEIVTANQTGLFAPLGNIDVLARQVLYACENYPAFSTAVIERARSNFDEAVMWQGYESLIARISTLAPLERSKAGQQPTTYKPPLRRFQLVPASVRSAIREFIGRSPRLGYWLRDLRGL
ncbi:glycosyltransferase [Microcoleus sp. FACHB-SPT15]|uniref:glycosyltransferase family 4 protein n=1 Tax=Microcoleus sp. FACHB-SPT15 TaxID=2692830 RepID=UPI001781927F|nr:glycosyltransferase [Microcoleus sp. FACHB-SPT15]MBD1805033.1 glycosyltransferase [Microcoleus sp. FACHB-SPT15]